MYTCIYIYTHIHIHVYIYIYSLRSCLLQVCAWTDREAFFPASDCRMNPSGVGRIKTFDSTRAEMHAVP